MRRGDIPENRKQIVRSGVPNGTVPRRNLEVAAVATVPIMDQYSSEDVSFSPSLVVADIPEPQQHQYHHQQQLLPRTRNGRKRKYIADDADIENQRPAKRHGGERRSPIEATSAPTIPPPSVASSNSAASSVPPSSVQTSSSLGEYPTSSSSDTQSSSECYSTTAEFDLYPLASPPSVNSVNILSPVACDAAAAASRAATSWNTKGDTTPHGHRKQHLPNSDNSSSKNSSNKSRVSGSASALSCCVTPSVELRPCPLPPLAWAKSTDVWRLMCRKDEKASLEREPNMFDQHPGLQPRMRAILLDWLIEVCEVYKLHRETYYLAVDYIDRFLSRKKEQKKTHLQLLGITSLFVAAKVEEIYPPKIGEFAYVTDGACSEEDILREELLLLSELQWSINPVTVMGWLGVYMQLNVTSRVPETLYTLNCGSSSSNSRKQQQQVKVEPKWSESFVYPQFSGMEFVQTAQLVDLCSLDVGLANFPYSVIAAAAISHTFDRKTATSVSGLDWEVIAPCAKWMEPYFLVICDENEISPLALLESNEQVKGSFGLAHVCPKLVTDSSHIIQTHTTSLDMFDRAAVRRERLEVLACMVQQEASPAPILLDPEGLLTPPASSRKSLDANNPASNVPTLLVDVENKVVSAKT